MLIWMNNKIHILKRNGAEMQKSLMISLSSILIIAPISEAQMFPGFFTTKECLKKNLVLECSSEELKKVSQDNPLILFQEAEAQTYILDISDLNQSEIQKIKVWPGTLIFGNLMKDDTTIKVKRIHKSKSIEKTKDYIEMFLHPELHIPGNM